MSRKLEKSGVPSWRIATDISSISKIADIIGAVGTDGADAKQERPAGERCIGAERNHPHHVETGPDPAIDTG